jgi:hypothetical protein
LEQVFSRYGVIFSGKRLPNGEKADAVYVVLNPIYQHFLSEVMFRYLDVGYMKSLGQPSAQRWYEWVSYRMHGAIGQGKSRVTVRYSDFCECAPLKRQLKDKSFYNQMGAIHKPHLKSGYLSKVGFTKITDPQGQTDWLIHYTPGIRARNEYHVSKRREAERNEANVNLAAPVSGLLTGEFGTVDISVAGAGVAENKRVRRRGSGL